MKVLVIGGGGREHAIAWKLSQSPKVTRVFVAPGNGGTALSSHLENIAITDVRALREWAQKEKIALTVVGPRGPAGRGRGG
jgi:phosphoribosylamine--glycine ligase